MSKSVTQLNPKAKQQQEKSFLHLKILIAIQFILTISVIILGIVTIINPKLIYIFEYKYWQAYFFYGIIKAVKM